MDDLTKIYVSRLIEGKIECFSVDNKTDKDAIVAALHAVGGHHGVVIAGNSPWSISLMRLR